MANSSRIPLRFYLVVPVLLGLLLVACICVIDTRADTLPAISEQGIINSTCMDTSALTGTVNIYLPYMQRNLPTVCGYMITDTVWMAAEGAYQVICDVMVYPGATLTIEAGVIVQFHNVDSGLYVFGSLWAEGTGQAPIRFQPLNGTNPGSWFIIDFEPDSSGVLDHTIIEYGGIHSDHDTRGMVNIYSSDVQVLDSVIRGSGDIGLVVGNASPVIRATQFLTNSGDTGGGLFINNGSPTIQNNIFMGNSAISGGGLHSTSGDPIILNNIFYANSAENGGGLYVDSGNAIIRNNIFVKNTASVGGGISVAGGTPRLDYNNVWNNTGGDYQGLIPGGHDVSGDPQWINPASGDFHLATGSACIDAGDPDHHAEMDIDGDLRPMGLAPDIGIDEIRDLGIIKTVSSEEAYPGAPISYTIQVINHSPNTLTNVRLTDTLPVEATYTGYQADDLTCTNDGTDWGGLLSCELDSASLTPGESRMLTLTVKLTETLSWRQYVTNTVILTANGGEESYALQDKAFIWNNWCRVRLNDRPMGDDLQAAINASMQTTDVVKVSGYCYKHGLHLEKTLTLQGGWKWDFSEQNLDVYTTTLDGHELGRVIRVEGEITPTIDGFVITGGYVELHDGGIYIVSGNPTIQNNTFTNNLGGGLSISSGSSLIQDNTFTGNTGGGLYNDFGSPLIRNNIFNSNIGSGLDNEYGSPIIQDNIFTNNSAWYFDGALFNRGGNPLIQNNIFLNNNAIGLCNLSGSPLVENNTFIGNYPWGGMYNLNGNPTVQNNLFQGNSFEYTGGGGGLLSPDGSPVIQNNIFVGNTAPYGGGLYSIGGVIQNNIFISNTAENCGGGLFLAGSTIILNNIVVNNIANVGGGVCFDYSDLPTLDYNDVWNNTGGDYFGIVPGPHDISADPLLVDLLNGDYHLASGSPCIDAGDPLNYPPTDFEGDTRPNGVAPDIGADEYYPY